MAGMKTNRLFDDSSGWKNSIWVDGCEMDRQRRAGSSSSNGSGGSSTRRIALDRADEGLALLSLRVGGDDDRWHLCQGGREAGVREIEWKKNGARSLQHGSSARRLERGGSGTVAATIDVRKTFHEREGAQADAISSKANNTPPTGAPKAEATPAAVPAVTKSRASFSLRRATNALRER